MSSVAITKLLQSEPLYRKIQVNNDFYHPYKWVGFTFQFHCKTEGGLRTFKLSLEPEQAISSLTGKETQDYLNPFKSDTEVDFINFYTGTCQSCLKEKVRFLLNVFSEGILYRSLLEPNILAFRQTSPEPKKPELKHSGKLYARKVGQWPSYQTKPDATLYNFLDKEDQDYYNKALICLSQNYGVASFAYLRKIVEKEIVRIVEAMTSEGSGNTEEIVKLLQEYRGKKQMAPLVENIFNFLPDSLKTLGDNPFKLLYGYLSDGIHNLDDEQCLQRAIALDKLLQYTIKKLREDQTELREIKDVIKNLRQGS